MCTFTRLLVSTCTSVTSRRAAGGPVGTTFRQFTRGLATGNSEGDAQGGTKATGGDRKGAGGKATPSSAVSAGGNAPKPGENKSTSGSVSGNRLKMKAASAGPLQPDGGPKTGSF
ncbi:hypothetical protein C8R43DRAFT_956850 [Mycena crocata]|nr:hypothetical protein C8R43DRAFT_956850 [Mycena crocata]